MSDKQLHLPDESQNPEPTHKASGIQKQVEQIKSGLTRATSVFTKKQLLLGGALSPLVILGGAWAGAMAGFSLAPAVGNGSLTSLEGKNTDSATRQSDIAGTNGTTGAAEAKKAQAGTSKTPAAAGTNPTSTGSSSNPAVSGGGSTPTPTPTPTNSAVKTLLTKHTVGSLHEAIPHGVPANHEHRTKAVLKNPAPPNAEMTYINIRGAVYVDESNYRAPNVRVEIMNCQTYGLKASTNVWEKLIDLSPGKLAGKGWREDFSTPGDAMYTNIRTEASGSKSVINYDGYNLHYFNNTNLAPLVYVGYNYSEFVTGCSSRLILEDPSGPDNRGSSKYIITAGNDWKKGDNTCTVNQSGATLCYAIGAGRFIKVANNWRRVIYSSLDSTDLNSKPLPPEALFLNPDGSFGD